jgi:hypothetical protein
MKLALDTLDDRREVWGLLHRLPPGKRVRFLQWAASQAKSILGGNKPVHTTPKALVEEAVRDYGDGADVRLTTSLYTELGMLYAQWGVDPKGVAEELERRVKDFGREEWR